MGFLIACGTVDRGRGPLTVGIMNDNAELVLRFSLKGWNVKDNLSTRVRSSIRAVVPSEKVTTVMIKPKKWPRNVFILCADKDTKTKLMVDGIKLDGKEVELNEGGTGSIKLFVEEAPLEMPNHVIKKELNKLGVVTSFREQYYFDGDVKTDWFTGTRIAFMRSVKQALPPTLMVEFCGYKHKIILHHEGQTQFECRWCKAFFLRDMQHVCDKKPARVCFNCKSPDHINRDCPLPTACNLCKVTGHIAKDCPNKAENATPQATVTQQATRPRSPRPRGNYSLAEFPIIPPRPNKRRRRGTQESRTSDAAATADADDAPDLVYSNRESLDRSIREQADVPFEKGSVKALVIGTSNCDNLPLSGDDALELNTEFLVQGGLKVHEASTKLGDIEPGELLEMNAVISHVGSCDFPVESDNDIDNLFMKYTECISEISEKCPNARVFISSIPPRKGMISDKINNDIRKMNHMLYNMTKQEEKITYINHDVYLLDTTSTRLNLYNRDARDDIHLSVEGKRQMADYIVDHIKNDYFRDVVMGDIEELASNTGVHV